MWAYKAATPNLTSAKFMTCAIKALKSLTDKYELDIRFMFLRLR
jgi:hypothetical protein